MVFQGLSQAQAEQVWAPFLDWVRARNEYASPSRSSVIAMPARHFWDADFFRQHAAAAHGRGRPAGAPATTCCGPATRARWAGSSTAYQSAWLPAALLAPDARSRLADAMFAASRAWDFELHFNKGLAGAPAAELAAARDTATHPGMVDAFALAIMRRQRRSPAYPGMPGAGPDLARARRDAAGVGRAMDALAAAVAPQAGVLRLRERLLPARLATRVLGRATIRGWRR